MTLRFGTAQIGVQQAENIFHAVRFANDNGNPLNELITINLTDLGIPDHKAGEFFRGVRESITRHWRYQNQKGAELGTFDDVAVHENPEEGPRHVHWLLRVPAEKRGNLRDIIEARLKKRTGLECLGSSLHFKEALNTGTLAKYILKGVDPHYASHFHMEAKDQGFVVGRRTGASRSLGRTERKNSGWKRKRRPR